MSLKKMYDEAQGKSQKVAVVIGLILGIGIYVGYALLLNALYNLVGPLFGLPKLGFLHFASTVILIDLFLLHFGTLMGVKKSNNPQTRNIVHIANEDSGSELQ